MKHYKNVGDHFIVLVCLLAAISLLQTYDQTGFVSAFIYTTSILANFIIWNFIQNLIGLKQVRRKLVTILLEKHGIRN